MKAHKNREIGIANHWRETAIFVCLLLMLVSLLISRAALSVSTILFVCLTIVHKDFLWQVKRFFTTPFLLLFSLLFFIPFVSGLWSSDVDQWLHVVRVKLPLLFFPLAFAGNWTLSQKNWQWIGATFLVVTFLGCAWSLVLYAGNLESVHESYLRAKTMRAPLESDHIRFSWMVCVAVMLSFLLAEIATQKKTRIAFIAAAVFFMCYLHVLSARTGVLALYLFLTLYAVGKLYDMKNRKWAAGVFALLLFLPLLAYWALPTFRARIRYNVYDLSHVQQNQYLPGTSDGKRVLSLKAGWHLLQQNPLGVGAGDITTETDNWYAANFPQVLSTDKSDPSSEWLMYGGFAGWPGVILFSICMLVPYFLRPLNFQVFWFGLAATAALSFAVDMGLEVQYGIFLYAFVTFWWWRWFNGFTTAAPEKN